MIVISFKKNIFPLHLLVHVKYNRTRIARLKTNYCTYDYSYICTVQF